MPTLYESAVQVTRDESRYEGNVENRRGADDTVLWVSHGIHYGVMRGTCLARMRVIVKMLIGISVSLSLVVVLAIASGGKEKSHQRGARLIRRFGWNYAEGNVGKEGEKRWLATVVGQVGRRGMGVGEQDDER